VLDQTALYPEGGGQPADKGMLHTGDDYHKGPKIEVIDVQKYATARGGHVIAHKVKGGHLNVGDAVHGHVDWDRRMAHTRHHTATHLILASAKQVLGFHTWQGGAQKGHDRSRVDIQHYQRITEDQLKAIENLANATMLEARGVEKVWMGRDEAEKQFGMQLYQGGIPKGKLVRVVKVKDFDVECCGGTHVGSTNEIGPIKILRTERIQDGLERIEFAAGMAAIAQMQKKDELLKQAAETLSVQPEEVPKTASRFFEEWKQRGKQVEELATKVAQLEAQVTPFDTLSARTDALHGEYGVVWNGGSMTPPPNMLQMEAEYLVRKNPKGVGIALFEDGSFVIAAGPDSRIDARNVMKALTAKFGGRGGGKGPEAAQGKFTNKISSSQEVRDFLKSV
jgi:alanyl-tRNA synthetase